MVINILIFLLIIILILIIVNIILISVQPKNIYGGTPTDTDTKFNQLTNYLDNLKDFNLNNKTESELLASDSLVLGQNSANNKLCKYLKTIYDEVNMHIMSPIPINTEYEELRFKLLNKYYSWNFLHYHFVEILMQITRILEINTLLECAAGSGMISAFIAYTSNGKINVIATDSNEEKFSAPYYKILQEGILTSIQNHPSQIALVSRGRKTFMNGMFVKTWIKQNVGKIIILILISTIDECEGQEFINILDANYFQSYELGHNGLLFENNGIYTDYITIYVKNVLTDEYIDIIDDEDEDDESTSRNKKNKNKCFKPKCSIM
jgi:hypothetical protein